MRSLIYYIMLTAIRDYLYIGLLAVVGVIALLSIFLGNTALVEQSQTGVTYMAGGFRYALSLGVILFTSFHIKRMYDNKEIEMILSGPISRSQFILVYFIAMVMLILSLVLPVFLIFLSLAGGSLGNILLWSMSLAQEMAIVMSFTMLASLMIRSSVSVSLIAIGFYLLSRLVGFFHIIFNKLQWLPTKHNFVEWSSGSILKIISIFLPRLDLFANSDWLIYQDAEINAGSIYVQAVIYMILLLVALSIDFSRKEI